MPIIFSIRNFGVMTEINPKFGCCILLEGTIREKEIPKRSKSLKTELELTGSSWWQ
jgi:hypothetical protein